MNILIYGIGGVGGYFGGKLTKTNNHITFIARGKHLDAVQKNGLQVSSYKGDFVAGPDLATDDLSKIPTPDLVILGVKSWQVPETIEALKPYVKPKTLFLPLQNGAANAEKILEVLPNAQVLGGLCRIVAFKDGPGKIKHLTFEPSITFGELDGSLSDRVKALQELFQEADFVGDLVENIQVEIWKKFLFICTISGIGGLTRVPMGKIRSSEYLFNMMKDTAQEIFNVAKAKGIALTEKHMESVFEAIQNQGADVTASTQRDIMEGKPSELDNFNGYIVREGKRLGVSVPVNELIYECLLPMEKEARKL
ncbi:ketopantoate reductase family protein [Leeuwenhoekiella marinoflava]|uniref:2-dehydropantoate 2-reductase n=2 Tax=Leeuwenhoekiella marinoflava TaxID=988 RepID=A0A4Q0PRH7_9FLAO|nr:2-dehydropantoate 2-reductase [Leeuwenhoekiella marinoflava]RXG33249.1 ketopantoate reductase [Leeuwenhoekiella marinoflava]SHE44288.1 ketopantoate reductase [Leeuwenhoekiella marinoflava DSM 3653]